MADAVSDEWIDLYEPIHEICSRLGVEMDQVGCLVLDPLDAWITAKICRRNEKGHLFMDPDTRNPAFDWKHWRVRTWPTNS